MSAWLALVRAHARLWDEVEAHMRAESGLTMARFDVLMQLEQSRNGLRLSDLAEAVVLSPSGLSKLLDRMDSSELIERHPDPDDARSAIATITAEGRVTVRQARRAHHTFLRHRFSDVLTDRDLADLVRIMGRIDAEAQKP
jgi:DNA-binding MarR family transcriptional regulator